ncbi:MULTISPECIES: WXG100 family type VII secretion target [unclassified Knoellia]|uniref:WXG100 family type VII secretion target n=1 Tax=Knoellia altitudinis TaxID=3404795 RepID=UPI00361F3BD5
MVRVDDGGGGPTLNPKAKHYERELFKVFGVQTGSIYLTQTDWQNAKKQLEGLAKDVRTVHGELAAPSDGSNGWSGPAAEAARASLEKLSSTLDTRAGEIGEVDTSLGQVYKAVSDAKAAWYAEVASISTYVDPDDHKRLPAPYLPTAENADKYSVRDPAAAAAAEDALWEQRNQAAKKVLDQLTVDTQSAKGTMPIDVKDDTQTPYDNRGPASTDRTPGSAIQSSSSGGYIEGGHHVGTILDPDGNGDGDSNDDPPVILTPNPVDPEIVICGPDILDPDPVDTDVFDPISSDGDVTGSTGVNTGTGPGGSQGSYPTGSGGGGMGAGGLAAGGIGGAAGLGGLLRRGGGLAGGGSSAVRGGAAGTRGSAARSGGAARGGSAVPGGAGRGGTVVPGSGGGARGGASGRTSAVKGATGSGRYGVPKLAGKGGPGVVPAGGGQAGRGTGSGKGGARSGGQAGGRGAVGAAGGGGTRKGPKDGQSQDVDKLTHEDEETWFDGTEESSPQVWQ